MNINRVLIGGNLTRDIELTNTPSSCVAKMGIAVNRKYKSGNEMKEETTFIDCEAWGKTAETVAKFLGRGSPVFIEGRLKLDEWVDKATNQKRYKLKVVVDQFHFVGGKGTPAPAGAASQPGLRDDDADDAFDTPF